MGGEQERAGAVSQTGHNSALAPWVLSPFGPCRALETPGLGSLESPNPNPMFPLLVPHPSPHRPPEHSGPLLWGAQGTELAQGATVLTWGRGSSPHPLNVSSVETLVDSLRMGEQPK